MKALLLLNTLAKIIAVHSGIANAQGEIIQLSVRVASIYKGLTEAGGGGSSPNKVITGIRTTGQPPQ